MKLLELNKNKMSGFKKRRIQTEEQLVRFLPNGYTDTTVIQMMTPELADTNVTLIATLNKVELKHGKNSDFVLAKLKDCNSLTDFSVVWFNQPYIVNAVRPDVNKQVLVHGKLNYDVKYNSFSITNPYVFTSNIQENMKLLPDYPEVKNSSNRFIYELIGDIIPRIEETLPNVFFERYHLPRITEALLRVHKPYKKEDIEFGLQRMCFDEMLYFSMEMFFIKNKFKEVSFAEIKSMEKTLGILKNLKYELTKDQDVTFQELSKSIFEQKTINALIQGDVGCGKTILAFLLSFLLVENGYQAVIMAPLSVLAHQHYLDLVQNFGDVGFRYGYLDSDSTAKERKLLLKQLKQGEIDILVGTHSLLSDEVEFANLGLIIVDEEHRFGVEQRDSLRNRSNNGTHFISMSATPIPRTTAGIVYGKNVTIHNILSMPNGRIPIKTYKCSGNQMLPTLRNELQNGRQAYIVCPSIETNEKTETLLSVEEGLNLYQGMLSDMPGIKIGVLNGKMKAKEKEEVLKAFIDNEIQVLISTTVIEVGVNNPNASVIIIHNAERFGLSTLHQLRGRVGRGIYQSYCVLVSEKENHVNIDAMCQFNSGFDISEIDFQNRGPGNILGKEQSGLNKYINLIRSYPEMYSYTESIAEWLMKENMHEKHLLSFREMNNLEKSV